MRATVEQTLALVKDLGVLDLDIWVALQAEVENQEAQLSPDLPKDENTVIQDAITALSPRFRSIHDAAPRLAVVVYMATASSNNADLVRAIDASEDVNTLRGLALDYDPAAFDILKGFMPAEDAGQFNTRLAAWLFKTAPTAVIQGMLRHSRIVLDDQMVSSDISRVLSRLDLDAIPKIPISTIQASEAAPFADVYEGRLPAVIQILRAMSVVARISSNPAEMEALFGAKIGSASAIARMPQDEFIGLMAPKMDADVASRIHANAVDVAASNERRLVAFLDAARGTGLKAIDGDDSPEYRQLRIRKATEDMSSEFLVNFDTLFGSVAPCACEECATVYSAANYFVDLLEYLRKSSATSDKSTVSPSEEASSLKGTVLEKLFLRRPDLANLRLTCENTNTILPYIDLANEVMESYITHMDSRETGPVDLHKTQIALDTYNVGSEDTKELLAEPQHTNMAAYAKLAGATFPFSLPYHQPIDSQRRLLSTFMSVSRAELLQTFPYLAPDLPIKPGSSTGQRAEIQRELCDLQQIVNGRQYHAEILGLVQEEYIILTGEAFYPRRWFEILQDKKCSEEEYAAGIGALSNHFHWGYPDNDALGAPENGLRHVKSQFLPRSGVAFDDLLQMLQTAYINPKRPHGFGHQFVEAIQFAYKYFIRLHGGTDIVDSGRFDKLAATMGDILEQWTFTKGIDVAELDIRGWLADNLPDFRKLIVVEAGEGPRFAMEGDIMAETLVSGFQLVGHIDSLGGITKGGNLVGHVTLDGTLVTSGSGSLSEQYGAMSVQVFQTGTQVKIGEVLNTSKQYIVDTSNKAVGWVFPSSPRAGFNIDNALLVHLDGTSLEVEEWDRMHKFIRLWRKLGWSIDEVDSALSVVNAMEPPVSKPAPGYAQALVAGRSRDGHRMVQSFDEFGKHGEKKGSAPLSLLNYPLRIRPETLHHLATIKELCTLTSFSSDELLVFWGTIPTAGDSSLYSRLFLENRPQHMKEVFGPNKSGEYLTSPSETITGTASAIMAALEIDHDDLNFLLGHDRRSVPLATAIPDSLTLDAVSQIYRHALLATVLDIEVHNLGEILGSGVFSDPFASPDSCLAMLKKWHTLENAGLAWDELRDLADLSPDAAKYDTEEVLRLVRDIHCAILKIRAQHRFVATEAEATEELVRAKLSLLYDKATVERICRLLDGSLVSTCQAPSIKIEGFAARVSEETNGKVTYIVEEGEATAHIHIKGILIETAIEALVGLASDADSTLSEEWGKCVRVACGQPRSTFRSSIDGIFPRNIGQAELEGEHRTILAPDGEPEGADLPGDRTWKTAAEKRFFLLQHLIPYLRDYLIRKAILKGFASAVGFHDASVAKTMFENIPLNPHESSGGHWQSALDFLLKELEKSSQTAEETWKGYLVVSYTGTYTFTVMAEAGHEKPKAVHIGGTPYEFDQEGEDSGMVYFTTTTVELKSTEMVSFEITGVTPGDQRLQWKGSARSRTAIPEDAFLPEYARSRFIGIYRGFRKLAAVMDKFKLRMDEICYMSKHYSSFDMDFMDLQVDDLLRLKDFADLRQSTRPKKGNSLLGLWKWIEGSENTELTTDKLWGHIADATGWNVSSVIAIASRALLPVPEADPMSAFRNEKILCVMSKMMGLSRKVGASIDRILDWTIPPGTSAAHFNRLHRASQDVEKTARSRFKLNTKAWQDAAKPVFDALREKQQQALVDHILSRDEIRALGIGDADGLFEYFLIDTQMTSLVETSRIKQAISTIQVFVQRCMLGLEEGYGVELSALNRKRWEWMRSYRLWEANRKVFLYPENWIEPSLRDNKTELFGAFEQATLGKNLSIDAIRGALGGYLHGLQAISNLFVVGLCVDSDPEPASDLIHVFARTRSSPFSVYHNSFSPSAAKWESWRKMGVELPTYTVEKLDGLGTYTRNPSLEDVDIRAKVDQRLIIAAEQDAVLATFNQPSAHPLLDAAKQQLATEFGPGALSPDFGKPVTTLFDPASKPGTAGIHMLPCFFKNRLVVFFPQIRKSTAPKSKDKQGKVSDMANKDASEMGTKIAWEIKLSWTELRNGSWTPRQLSPDAAIDQGSVGDFGSTYPPSYIDSYSLIPDFTSTQRDTIRIHLLSWGTGRDAQEKGVGKSSWIGTWLFRYNEASLTGEVVLAGDALSVPTFGYRLGNFTTLSAKESGLQCVSLAPMPSATPDPPGYLIVRAPINPAAVEKDGSPREASLVLPPKPGTISIPSGPEVPLGNPIISELISQFARDDDAAVFEYLRSLAGAGNEAVAVQVGLARDPSLAQTASSEAAMPFSLYTWEIGFHIPMLLVDQLCKTQQFDRALSVCHWIFDPTAKGDKADNSRFWNFPPFRQINKQTIEDLLFSFKAGEDRSDVKQWRDSPFSPHLIARGRPLAYMKWVVMKYIEVLIAYGDYYFRMNTLEAIPEAVQMYILASHLYGPRGGGVKKPRNVQPQTYNSLLGKFDAFSNAMVWMEDSFPFCNQTPLSALPPANGEAQPSDLLTLASTLYFAVPDNPNLRELGQRIDDRLFKIRHSQNINGIFRKLPLFEPPIDPGLLIEATALGVPLNNVLQDLEGPMPSCRFSYLLQRAIDLAADLQLYAQSLVKLRRWQDKEAYAVLLAKHKSSSADRALELRQTALDEANKSLDALVYSRQGPESRMRHFLKLAGKPDSLVPKSDSPFSELDQKLQDPVDNEGIHMLESERAEMGLIGAGMISTGVAAGFQELVGDIQLWPEWTFFEAPLGIGTSTNADPAKVSKKMAKIAKGFRLAAKEMSMGASIAGKVAAAKRGENERLLQANMAGYEISRIDKQIVAARIKVELAQKEVDAANSRIKKAKEVEDFLQNTYTGEKLYGWLISQSQQLYSDVYNEAYELAQKVEKAFRFERPTSPSASTTFVKPSFWDASRDGLLAGDHLYHALKQIQGLHMADRGHDYEITKNVSLRQLNPMQLLALRESGRCEFSLPEVIFDMDFPGHYSRRIRSVGVSIPCSTKPRSGVNATLRLQRHRYRVKPTVGARQYQEKIAGPGDQSLSDDRFSTTHVPITAIAVSTPGTSGATDSGVFELNFSGERYLPFEGAGAISDWVLELPGGKIRAFDYTSISDVVVQMRYTSVEGGQQLREAATGSVDAFISSTRGNGGLVTLVDVKTELSEAFGRLASSEGKEVKFDVPSLDDRLSLFSGSEHVEAENITARDIWLVCMGSLPGGPSRVTIAQKAGSGGPSFDSAELEQKKGAEVVVPGSTVYAAHLDGGLAFGDWTVTVPEAEGGADVLSGEEGAGGELTRVWVVVRYVVKE